VAALYFITAVIAQVAEIILVHDVHGDGSKSVTGYQIPELILDVIFLSWIYYALGSTIRILSEFQQTHKLRMYKQLAFVISLFVGLFASVTVLILLDKYNIIEWPWQWSWVQQVLWEVLNFAVLASVCLICRPSGKALVCFQSHNNFSCTRYSD
jgi:Lung seven transmembrane receptor